MTVPSLAQSVRALLIAGVSSVAFDPPAGMTQVLLLFDDVELFSLKKSEGNAEAVASKGRMAVRDLSCISIDDGSRTVYDFPSRQRRSMYASFVLLHRFLYVMTTLGRRPVE
jgi:hypothetical protein